MPEKHVSKLITSTFSLKSNIFATFLANSILTAASIIFVPIYIRYIGVEAYGLVGFFTSFQAVLTILDLGLSVTLTRELALRHGNEAKAQESRNLARTLEIIYWSIAFLLGFLAIILVPFLTNWVNPQQLSPEVIRSCFVIMAIIIVLQFPISFYQGGLFGLQKQVLSSVITIFFSLFRYVGALAALHFILSSPQTFFLWQAVSSGFQVATLGICLWLSLPRGSESTRFQKDLLRDFWRFTAGMGGIGILAILLMQVDKFVLVRILPLESFGYYSIASLAATAVFRIIQPMFQVYFPKFSQLVGKADREVLVRTYHQGCQIMAVIILPIATMFIFFSREIMFLWQKSDEIAGQTALLVSLLAAGYTMNGLINIPYALQFATGWTKLYFYSLLAVLIVSIPATILSALYFGAAGAAFVVIMANASFVFVTIPLMHRRLVPGEMWKWYGEDVCLPLIGAAIVGLCARFLFVANSSQTVIFIQLAVIFCLTFLVTCLITPFTRTWIAGRFFRQSGSV